MDGEMHKANRLFAEWVEWTGESQTEIAQRLECSQVKVSHLVLGKQSAGPTLAKAIEREMRKPSVRDGKRERFPGDVVLHDQWPDKTAERAA
jgi:hypothetical protein